jgi:hypothetical protein
VDRSLISFSAHSLLYQSYLAPGAKQPRLLSQYLPCQYPIRCYDGERLPTSRENTKHYHISFNIASRRALIAYEVSTDNEWRKARYSGIAVESIEHPAHPDTL